MKITLIMVSVTYKYRDLSQSISVYRDQYDLYTYSDYTDRLANVDGDTSALVIL